MHFTGPEIARLIVVLAIEGLVCGMAWWRGLYKRLPLLAVYLSVVVACDIIRFTLIFTLGPRSKEEFIAYWATQAVMMLLRAAVIYELCEQLLSDYPGVWRLCVMILFAAAFVLVGVSLMDTMYQGPWVARLFLTFERGMEVEVLGVLVVALCFCRYYKIPVNRLAGLVALGLSLYSAIAILNNTFASHWFGPLLRVWAEIRGDSFILAEIVWLVALWKPLPEQQRSPELLDSRVYSEMTPVVNFRLRELNAHLEEILR
jgi:hypothetical protein